MILLILNINNYEIINSIPILIVFNFNFDHDLLWNPQEVLVILTPPLLSTCNCHTVWVTPLQRTNRRPRRVKVKHSLSVTDWAQREMEKKRRGVRILNNNHCKNE